MQGIQPYLNFDGQAAEAMRFYQGILGGKLEVQSFEHAGMEAPPGAETRTMHATLENERMNLMASDTMPGQTFVQGNNVWISVACDAEEEIDRFFAKFSEGGKVAMPLAMQFWGAKFGMLTDKFGVNWMFNCQLNRKA